MHAYIYRRDIIWLQHALAIQTMHACDMSARFITGREGGGGRRGSLRPGLMSWSGSLVCFLDRRLV